MLLVIIGLNNFRFYMRLLTSVLCCCFCCCGARATQRGKGRRYDQVRGIRSFVDSGQAAYEKIRRESESKRAPKEY